MPESFELTQPLHHPQSQTIAHLKPLPTVREWIKHLTLFLLTAITTTFAGIWFNLSPNNLDPQISDPVTWLDYLLYIPTYYFKLIAAIIFQAINQPDSIKNGLIFSICLLIILTLHEAGHYLACRYYNVAATLPYFIPAPPPLLTGTFGAFIKIKSPFPSRRAIFDIGIAGPIAGFIATVPIAIVAILTAQTRTSLPKGEVLVFHDPLLLHLISNIFNVDLSLIEPNSYYLAAWIGLLVTCLNLMPVGQLDGGHTTYAMFGSRIHKILGFVAFITMAITAILGMLWYSVPTGIVYTILLFIMLRIRHPQAIDETKGLGRNRILIMTFTILIFILSFVPIPITIESK
jgi:membrane-associated protease RseP (regulator of RpoE activity)